MSLIRAALLFMMVVLSLSITGITGCATTGKVLDLDTRVQVEFEVFDDINPDDSGRPSPLVVRFYELKDARQFQAEDFLGLFEDDSGRLGGDLLAKRRLEFQPGKSRIEEFVVDQNTRYIGLLAEFVQYENAKARVIFEVAPNQKTKQVITIKKLELIAGEFYTPETKEKKPLIAPSPYHVGE